MKKIIQSLVSVLITTILGMVFFTGCGRGNESSDNLNQNIKESGAVLVGQNIDTALKLMASHGNGTPMLEMETIDADLQMKMWPVWEGVLISEYSETDRSIKSLSFCMSDERPKALRKTFECEVSHYFPKTGEMRITVPNKLTKTD